MKRLSQLEQDSKEEQKNGAVTVGALWSPGKFLRIVGDISACLYLDGNAPVERGKLRTRYRSKNCRGKMLELQEEMACTVEGLVSAHGA